ncbi:MAG: hypothetical protein AAB579_01915 [Patescibacteria group bacterium]
MDIRGIIQKVVGGAVREVWQMTQAPLAHWSAQVVTIALEPPVDGRTEVRFEMRVRRAPMHECGYVLYKHLRPLADEGDWQAIENQFRGMQKCAGMADEVMVAIAMTHDVTLADRARREVYFSNECIERPLCRVLEASFGHGHAAPIVIHADVLTYFALFGRSREFAPLPTMAQ